MLAAFRKTLSQNWKVKKRKRKSHQVKFKEELFRKITENVRFHVRQAMLGETASFLTEACLTSRRIIELFRRCAGYLAPI